MAPALYHAFRLLTCASVLLLSSLTTSAQQNVGIGTTTPHASAALDVSATNKGLLVPRLTQAQRTAMTNVADGLLVFQTNNGGGFWYYYGGQWNAIPNAATAGDNLGNHTATGPLKYNFNDGEKIQFVPTNGANGSKLTHTANWALGYYAGPTSGPFAEEGEHRFFTGGTSWRERLRITPQGNVGIGTTTPTTTLDVAGEINSGGLRFSTNDADKLLLTRSFGANGPKLAHSTGWNLDYYAGPNNAVAGTHRFFTGTAAGWLERFRVDASGNVGIGTAVPTSLLHVGGTAGTPNVRLESLGGTNTRMVAVDANGVLTSAALPTASNGLTANANNVKLGGGLTESTQITTGGWPLTITNASTPAGTLDQQCTGAFGAANISFFHQTFTAGASGLLTRVEVTLFAGPYRGPVTVGINVYEGSTLTGRRIATHAVTYTVTSAFMDVGFDLPNPPPVGGGQVYALHVSQLSSFKPDWAFPAGDPYPGGQRMQATGPDTGDLCFSTFVAVGAQPSGLTLLNGRLGVGTRLPGALLDVNGTLQTLNLQTNSLTSNNVTATAVATSSVNTATVTTPTTGNHNMLAVAYGTIGGSASVFGSSDNWTVARTAAGTYRITFTSADLSAAALGSAVVQVSAYGSAAGFISWDGNTGYINVYLRNTAGTLTDRSFSFTVFQP